MHRETKATSIPTSVKWAVFCRDNCRCVLCGSFFGEPVAHVVRRSKGGMGIEQNVVTLCPDCHRSYDQGQNRKALYARLVAYMKGFYPDWNREDMIYKKGME